MPKSNSYLRDYDFPLLEPKAKEAVDCCVKERAVLIMSVGGFDKSEGDILVELLRYAHSKGIGVLFAPNPEKEREVMGK